MSDLYRLVYTSGRMKNCDDQEIQNILQACKRNNPSKNITGVLIHTDKRFIQVLEGKEQDILDVFEKVKKDPRHAGVSLRALNAVKTRAFPNWHMGYKDISTEKLKYDTSISSVDLDQYQSILSGKDAIEDESGMKVLKLFMKVS